MAGSQSASGLIVRLAVAVAVLFVLCGPVLVSASQPFSVSDNRPNTGCIGLCHNIFGAWGDGGCRAQVAPGLPNCACAAGCGCAVPALNCSRYCVSANTDEYAQPLSSTSISGTPVNSGDYGADFGVASSAGVVASIISDPQQVAACIVGCQMRGICNQPTVPPNCNGDFTAYPLANLTGCATYGDYTIETNFNDTQLIFPGLTSIKGFWLIKHAVAVSISFPDLLTIDGGIRFSQLSSLVTISAPQLTTVTGYLAFDSLPVKNFLGFTLLDTVTGRLSIETCRNITAITTATAFPALTSVGTLIIDEVAGPAGTQFVYNKPLTRVGGFQIAASPAVLTFPSKVGGRLANAELEGTSGGSILVNGLTDVYHAESIVINATGLSTLTFANGALSAIANVTNRIQLMSIPASTGLGFLSNLRSVSTLQIIGNGQIGGGDVTDFEPLCLLTRLDFLKVSNLGDMTSIASTSGPQCLSRIRNIRGLQILNNARLASVNWLSGLRTALSIHVVNNPLLTTFVSLNGMTAINGQLEITGNHPTFEMSSIGPSTGIRIESIRVAAKPLGFLADVWAAGDLNNAIVLPPTNNLRNLFNIRNVSSPSALNRVGGVNVTDFTGLCRILPKIEDIRMTVVMSDTYCQNDARRQFGQFINTIGGDAAPACNKFLACSCENMTASTAGNPCNHGGTCVTTPDSTSYTCQCAVGYRGPWCDILYDNCASAPCNNGGTCTNHPGSFSCACVPGYGGAMCQSLVNECDSSPCQNGGNCTDLFNHYTCQCSSEFSGANCQNRISPCASMPCQRGAACIDSTTDFSFTCQCPRGTTGSVCQTDINECGSSPCINSGTCIDGIGSYSCQCTSAWKGTRCQQPTDPCGAAVSPCPAGYACVNGANGFLCEAIAGATATASVTRVGVALLLLLAGTIAVANRR